MRKIYFIFQYALTFICYWLTNWRPHRTTHPRTTNTPTPTPSHTHTPPNCLHLISPYTRPTLPQPPHIPLSLNPNPALPTPTQNTSPQFSYSCYHIMLILLSYSHFPLHSLKQHISHLFTKITAHFHANCSTLPQTVHSTQNTLCMCTTLERNRHCTYSVTRWRVQVTIDVMESNKYSIRIVYAWVTADNHHAKALRSVCWTLHCLLSHKPHDFVNNLRTVARCFNFLYKTFIKYLSF